MQLHQCYTRTFERGPCIKAAVTAVKRCGAFVTLAQSNGGTKATMPPYPPSAPSVGKEFPHLSVLPDKSADFLRITRIL
jgi:hypothetical protein